MGGVERKSGDEPRVFLQGDPVRSYLDPVAARNMYERYGKTSCPVGEAPKCGPNTGIGTRPGIDGRPVSANLSPEGEMLCRRVEKNTRRAICAGLSLTSGQDGSDSGHEV